MKDTLNDTEYVVNENHLNNVIAEYLLFSGFKDSAVKFSEECVNTGKPNPNLNQIQTAAEKAKFRNDLLVAYKSGNHTEFFSLWNDSLPQETINGDKECQRLEFLLQVYFAVYPKLSPLDSLDANESMARFRKYLDNRGSSFSQSRDLLSYFALPFVPDLRNHDEFKLLFKPEWSSNLRIKLESFLQQILKVSNEPKLVTLFKNQELIIKRANRNLQESEQRVVKYIKRFNKIQGDYHNLIGITAELVDVMEDSIKGKPVTPEYLRTVCARLFANNIANQSVDISRPGTASALLRQSVAVNESTSILKSVTSSVEAIKEPNTLDFTKIKRDLSTGNNRARGFLLQALRWRITKATSIQSRDEVMANYSSNDILGCAESGIYQDELLDLLNEGSLRQCFARLLNAIASLSAGRSYLSRNEKLIYTLNKSMQKNKFNDLSMENLLGCAQKLSLRRRLQTQMIQEGFIEWLISSLGNNESMSDYFLEYSVALLMNLCLRTAGKIRCESKASEALKVLCDLLGHENREVRPYVNGALYSILSRPSIRVEAKNMGLEDMLKYYQSDSNAEERRQMEFILKQLNSESLPNEEDNSASDDEDEEDDDDDQETLEEDIDKDDNIVPVDNDLYGDSLLKAKYGATLEIKTRKRDKGIASSFDLGPLQRPITPSTIYNAKMKQSYQSDGYHEAETPRLGQVPEAVTTDDKSRPVSQADINPNKMPSRLSSYGTTKSPRSQSLNEEIYNPHASSQTSIKLSNRSAPNSGKVKQRSSSLQKMPHNKQNEEVARPQTRSGSARSTGRGSNNDESRVRPSTVTKGRITPAADDEIVDKPSTADDPQANLPVDDQASEVISKALGSGKKIVQAENAEPVEPSQKAIRQASGKQRSNVGEYTAAFSSRPKIPRTPDGSQSLQSDRLPTPTHSSGVPTQSRPTSAASDKYSKAAGNDGAFKKPNSKSTSRPSSKK